MKNGILWLILKALFPVLFNAVFFLADIHPKNASVWISYVFVHSAYVLLLLTPCFTVRSRSAALFGTTLGGLGLFFFLTELALGSVLIAVRPDGWRTAFFLQLVLSVLHIAALTSTMLADQHTAGGETVREAELRTFKGLLYEMRRAVDEAGEGEEARLLRRTYDLMASSPVRSHPSVSDIERDLEAAIRALPRVGASGENREDIARRAEEIQRLIRERNHLLKRT